MLDRQSPFLPKFSPAPAAVAEQALQRDIITGVLAPGERLSEQVLCERYRLGRGLVRSALARLAHRGFVSSQARSGWKVSTISAVGFREVSLGRNQLEPLLADVELSLRDIERIEALADMQAALSSDARLSAAQITLLRGYDREIRDLLALRLNAPMIAEWLSNLWDKSELYLNYFESGAATRLPSGDWTSFIAAKRAGETAKAVAAISASVGDFVSFIQGRLLQANLEAPAAGKARATSTLSGNAYSPGDDAGRKQFKDVDR